MSFGIDALVKATDNHALHSRQKSHENPRSKALPIGHNIFVSVAKWGASASQRPTPLRWLGLISSFVDY